MARRPNIRITKHDRKEYARLVKNTKAKIARTRKNHNGHDISGLIEIPKISEFKDRKTFNQKKAEMKNFTSRTNMDLQFITNEHGVTISKSYNKKLTEDAKTARENALEQVERLQDNAFYSGGKETGSTVGQVSQQLMRPSIAGVIVPDEFDFSKVTNLNQLERTKKRNENRAKPNYYSRRMETMKENYLTVISATFNSYGDELVKELQSMPADDFAELYSMIREFAFSLYDSDQVDEDDVTEEMREQADSLLQYVQMYKSGELNNDLKNFDKPPQ